MNARVKKAAIDALNLLSWIFAPYIVVMGAIFGVFAAILTLYDMARAKEEVTTEQFNDLFTTNFRRMLE